MTSLPDRTRARPSRNQLRQRLRALRRQQARSARAARRRLERIHHRRPALVGAVFDPLEPAFTRPTYRRFLLLALAAILATGGRTVANLLRVLDALAPGHPSSFHRVFSRDRWSPWPWHAGTPAPSSPAWRPTARSRWPATTPSPSTPAPA